jgi:C_GCAxxG_C_C family probable redox protein
MTKSEKAIALFDQGFNCSQSVLTAFSEDYNISEDDCLKISCAFGGGMGRQQLTCGVVTGALMVLGLHFGRAKGDDISLKVTTYEKAVEFFEAFKGRNGATDCKELLLGLDMSNPADLKRIESLGLFKTSCYKYAKDAVDIAEKMIQQDQ